MQTIAARYWPARFDDARWGSETRFFETEPGVQVSARVNAADRDVLMLVVHGLTACSEARYMLTLAGKALEAGFGVIRLNVRNCGGTEHLSPTLYHSGLTTDLRAVIDQLAPRPLFVVGFSMGGNMALKLAGEWEDKPAGARPGGLQHFGADSAGGLFEADRRVSEPGLRAALLCGSSRRP